MSAAPPVVEMPTRAIVLLAVAGFVSAANLRICDPLLPQIASDFGVSVGDAGMIVTAFALSYGLFQLIVGPLGDARGKLRVIVLGCIWAGMATLACAAMQDLRALALLRFLAGIGGAAIIPLAVAWLGDVVPSQIRQPILARFASGQVLGVVLGQAAGGILGEVVGWRGAMVIVALAHLVAAGLLVLEMRRLTVGLPSPQPARWSNAARTAYAIVQQPWARILLSAAFLEGVLMFGAFAFVGAHLHLRFGIGPGLVGLSIAAYGIGALVYAVSASVLIPRWGLAKLLRVGSILLAVSYVSLAFTPWLWLVPISVALLGLGFNMLHNTLQTEATQLAPEARGLSVSLFAIMLFTGQAVGVVLAGRIFDHWGGTWLFTAAAAGMLALVLWFRVQLVRRNG